MALIDREELLNEISKITITVNCQDNPWEDIPKVMRAYRDAILSMPVIEQKPDIIYCKDCKYLHKDFCTKLTKLDEEDEEYNSYFLIIPTEKQNKKYCAWGEKIDEKI